MYKLNSIEVSEQDGEPVVVINYYSDEIEDNIYVAFKISGIIYCSDIIDLMQSADLEIKRINKDFSNES